MRPINHLFFGLVFSTFLFLLFPKIGFFGFSIIILSSVLTDVDHYFYYVHKKKKFNLKKCYNWYIENWKKFCKLSKKQKVNFYSGWYFFHGFEILVLLTLFGIFISKYFFFILIGFSFHLFIDLSNEIAFKDRIDKISTIYDFFKYKKIKNIEELDSVVSSI